MCKEQSNPNNNKDNKDDDSIRKSITFPLKLNNNRNDTNETNETSKVSNKVNNLVDKNKVNNDSNSVNKNKLVTGKKFNSSNTNTSTLYNTYNNLKIPKTNNNTDNKSNNINKILNSSYVNNSIKSNPNNLNSSKKKRNIDKKLTQFAARINNYYNKNNTENKYSKITLNKKRGSIPDNNVFNFNKYLTTSSKNQTIYRTKKEGNRINFYNQLNIITSTIKNDNNNNNNNNNNYNTTIERNRHNSIHTKYYSSSNKILSLDNIKNSYSEIREKKEKIIKIFKNNKKITSREESFYILATSPILRLNEQLIFSRATKNVRNVLPINNILNNHNIFLNAKANELIKEISLCEKTIKTPFTASKIADITLNFITSVDEQEFKDFDILESNKDTIRNYYIFLKLLYILINVSYDKDLEGKKLKNYLFEKLRKKGFKNLKDYLYYIYIAKKEDINIVHKIEIINNDIINKYPEALSFQETFKICRFTAFTIYLIKEIINYANNIKDTIELKLKAQNFLEIVIGKIDKFQNKNNKIKKKKYN